MIDAIVLQNCDTLNAVCVIFNRNLYCLRLYHKLCYKEPWFSPSQLQIFVAVQTNTSSICHTFHQIWNIVPMCLTPPFRFSIPLKIMQVCLSTTCFRCHTSPTCPPLSRRQLVPLLSLLPELLHRRNVLNNSIPETKWSLFTCILSMFSASQHVCPLRPNYEMSGLQIFCLSHQVLTPQIINQQIFLSSNLGQNDTIDTYDK